MFPPELPPVSNRFLYAYRVLVKWFSFFVFGICTAILVSVIFPPMRLLIHPRERFKKYGRRFISAYMGIFISFMHMLRALDLEAGDRDSYRRLSSKIIVANHPSLIDAVMLLSLFPNADCIVNSRLAHNIVAGVIRQLYIFNSLEFGEILKACADSLGQGNCLIIFPEGTRTPRSGKPIVKKGAARISLSSGCGIIPLHIGGTDKFGLGKKDPWTGFNPTERYVYKISMGEELRPDTYSALPMPAAVRAMTRDLTAFILRKAPR